LRGIEYIDTFQPDSCPTNGTFKAARVAAGETGMSVNTELIKNNAIIVTGANPDVGIMGWLPGGGHGFLSSEYGMGADNLLEATIVTPDGSILLANPCQNTDLFYAIRGGGAGTFGVLLDAVVKAYDTPQTTTHKFAVQALSSNITNEFYDLVGYLSAELPRLKAGGMQGA
jgi:FAD/FMN-containing dehydrogenase